jgi:hypothetical protein
MRTKHSTQKNSNKLAAYERQRIQRESGAQRLAQRVEARAAERRAADALMALEKRWGGRADALRVLSEIGETIARIRAEEDRLRSVRDDLIDILRAAGESWNSLASRTGISRQGLNQRHRDVDGRL